MDRRLEQVVAFVDGQFDRYRPLVFIADFVLFDVTFGRAAAVLGGSGVWEMPFYVRGAGDERDVVEFDDLDWSDQRELDWEVELRHTLRWRSNLGCRMLA